MYGKRLKSIKIHFTETPSHERYHFIGELWVYVKDNIWFGP